MAQEDEALSVVIIDPAELSACIHTQAVEMYTEFSVLKCSGVERRPRRDGRREEVKEGG